MRICQVIESASGGSARVALALARGLAAAGDDVTFIYSPLRADQAFLDAKNEAQGVNFIPFEMRRSLGFHDLLSMIGLAQLLRRKGPFDAIHAHSSKAGGLLRVLRPLLPRRTSLVYTPHAFVTMGPEGSWIHGLIERALAPLCDAVVTVSQGERDHAVQALKIPSTRVATIVNGIAPMEALPRVAARDALGFGTEDTLIGFVGRFAPQKNVKRLIEAFAPLSARYPALRLVMLGDGPEEFKLHALIADKGLGARVKVLSGLEARPLYSAFDILACSSDYEGISLVFLEALMAGVPIVTTPVAGATETVREGETGLIAKDFTSAALGASLNCLLALPVDTRLQMGIAARRQGAKFTLDAMIGSYRNLYQQCLEQRACR